MSFMPIFVVLNFPVGREACLRSGVLSDPVDCTGEVDGFEAGVLLLDFCFKSCPSNGSISMSL